MAKNLRIESKLRDTVLPYLLLPSLLKKTSYFRLHRVITYTTVIVAALGGIGVSSPLAAVIGGDSTHPDFSAMTMRATVVGWTVAVAWVIVRAVYDFNSWGKAAALASSCARSFRRCEDTLENVLDQPEPLADLNELYSKQIEPMVDQLVQENALPFSLPEIRERLKKQIDERVIDLVKIHGAKWSPPPDDERSGPRPPADGGNS